MNRNRESFNGRLESDSPSQPWVLLFIAVCLVAVNMRMTITGVGPLLDQIADDRGISPAALGALGSVPLLTWALFSPVAHSLGARIGMSNAVSVSLVLLAGGTVWRSLDGSPLNLWLGTALTGAGLAVANVLLPAIIKRDFKNRVGLVMGVYSALLGGLGAVAAGVVVPISEYEVGGSPLGWQTALLSTGILLPIALVVWIWATEARRSTANSSSTAQGSPHGAPQVTRERDTAGRRVWGDSMAWFVSLYMGFQSTTFYIFATWLPTYFVSLGASPTVSGLALMAFQFFGITGSLMLPFVARGRMERWAPALLPAVGIIAWVGLVVAPGAVMLWIPIAGIVAGSLLTMSLTLMATRARTASDSSAVSGMAQSVGYALAALGPISFGALYGATGGWVAPFTVIWVTAILLFFIGLAAGRSRFVFDGKSAA